MAGLQERSGERLAHQPEADDRDRGIRVVSHGTIVNVDTGMKVK
jgi:hypothetical protein